MVSESDEELPADSITRDQWVNMMFDSDSDEDEEEFRGFHNGWTREPADFVSRVKSSYNRQPGVKIVLAEPITPVTVFARYFTEELWTRLVTETNRYAEQIRTPSSKWYPVTTVEMKCFIGLCLTMGILKLPTRRDYWRQKKWIFQTKLPEVMSRDRFAMIWR